jgi:hypothetical protein
VSDCSNLRASRCESATFCSDFRFLNFATWHVFNGLITRRKNAKIAQIAICVENVRGTNEIFNCGTAVEKTGYAASCAGRVAAGCDICKRLHASLRGKYHAGTEAPTFSTSSTTKQPCDIERSLPDLPQELLKCLCERCLHRIRHSGPTLRCLRECRTVSRRLSNRNQSTGESLCGRFE